MKADYKNWVPKGMIYGMLAGTAGLGAAYLGVGKLTENAAKPIRVGAKGILGAGLVGCGAMTAWCVIAHNRFSYDGERQMSKQIVEGTAEYVSLPEGGKGLDVGCGSGALTIACAKRNPQGSFVGIDRWGKEYASFNKELCESNARAEGVSNVSFQNGDAVKLDFDDETFDAVTSNYVYHNITGADKQMLLRETLRVLKKGGTFAIHDIMSKSRYGDMQKFIQELKSEGYEEVRLIPTDNGKFMSKLEGTLMMLSGSAILTGKK
ncbi:MAG: class I SAM-dependent methyltransferase [Blautia sp.]|nr:class I SAM-dependent methyltransferase [Blautia sp.]